MYQLHDRLLANTEQHIKELMAVEQEQIWTQNDHYIVSSKQCFEELLVKQMNGSGKASKPDNVVPTGSTDWTAKSYVDNALAYLLQAGINLSAEDLDIALAKKQQKSSEHEGGLLDLIAGTLAYYKVGMAHHQDIIAGRGLYVCIHRSHRLNILVRWEPCCAGFY